MKVVLTLTHEKRTVIHCKELVISPDDGLGETQDAHLQVESGFPGFLKVTERITDGST